MKKAKIIIAEIEDGEGWFIQRVDYVTSDVNPETGKHFPFGKLDFVDGKTVGIVEGKGIIISEEETTKIPKHIIDQIKKLDVDDACVEDFVIDAVNEKITREKGIH